MQLRRGIAFQSVTEQHPNPYWKLNDKWAQYVQVQRTNGIISGNRINFNVQGFDPNFFMRSKAYLKLTATIQKQEEELDAKEDLVERIASNYVAEDRIYKKPGMVLHNACTDVALRLNSHTMTYKDLRYVQKKVNMSFAGKAINNNYFSTSGGPYEEYNGVYDSFGNVSNSTSDALTSFPMINLGFVPGGGANSIRFISDTNIVIGSDTIGFDVAGGPNTVAFDGTIAAGGTNTLTFAPGVGGAAIDIIDTSPLHEGMVIAFTTSARTFTIETVLSPTTALAKSALGGVGGVAFGASALTVADTYTTNRETARLQFGNSGGGIAVDLAATQIFEPGDIITLNTGEVFKVIDFSGNDELIVGNVGNINDVTAQAMSADDLVQRASALTEFNHNADDGRQEAYDDAFRDITVGQTDNTFEFTEALSFGPWNHLADYDDTEIMKNAWNSKQTALVPYVRQINLDMTFKDIAANALIYPYGRLNNPRADPANSRFCELSDISIDTAELVLFWVKPRDELLMSMPRTVRIQSWQYDHKQFPLRDEEKDTDTVASGSVAVNSQGNVYTNQQPSYLLYYGMVDKDSDSYKCRAVNSSLDDVNSDQTVSVDVNSVEAGMRPQNQGQGTATFKIRSNTLGGDDILDTNYNIKELYRLTLKNSISNFPYGESKFRGLSLAESQFATYPSEFYLLLGEGEMNSFFVRKGQLQTSVVIDYASSLVATDGYSINKSIAAFNGGTKQYALHIIMLYDRFYLSLSDTGEVDSKFDASFY
jgi:hypothetical protein